VPTDAGGMVAWTDPDVGPGALTIAIRSSGDGPIELARFDVLGRRVAARDLRALPEGPLSVSYEIPPARSGVHFLKLRQGASEATRKIVVAR